MQITLILGSERDYHAKYMLDACRSHNIHARLFDTRGFPTKHKLGWQPHQQDGSIEIGEELVYFRQINSAFWSSIEPNLLHLDSDDEQHQIALNDSVSMLRTLFDEPQIKWVNSWQVYQFHKVKPRQLSLARQCGAIIPATYVGNQSTAIIEFVDQYPDAIYKPVYGGAHTAPVDQTLLEHSRLNTVLSISPVTIQQYIAGTNIRTFVVGNQIFSAELCTQATDFRADTQLEHIRISTPKAIQDLSLVIADRFGMHWTAIDWRRDLQGNYYFLEANPSPMFIHFERETGYPITECLLSLLQS